MAHELAVTTGGTLDRQRPTPSLDDARSLLQRAALYDNRQVSRTAAMAWQQAATIGAWTTAEAMAAIDYLAAIEDRYLTPAAITARINLTRRAAALTGGTVRVPVPNSPRDEDGEPTEFEDVRWPSLDEVVEVWRRAGARRGYQASDEQTAKLRQLVAEMQQPGQLAASLLSLVHDAAEEGTPRIDWLLERRDKDRSNDQRIHYFMARTGGLGHWARTVPLRFLPPSFIPDGPVVWQRTFPREFRLYDPLTRLPGMDPELRLRLADQFLRPLADLDREHGLDYIDYTPQDRELPTYLRNLLLTRAGEITVRTARDIEASDERSRALQLVADAHAWFTADQQAWVAERKPVIRAWVAAHDEELMTQYRNEGPWTTTIGQPLLKTGEQVTTDLPI